LINKVIASYFLTENRSVESDASIKGGIRQVMAHPLFHCPYRLRFLSISLPLLL